MKITTIGIDLAKNVFQLHGVNAQGKTVLKKQLRRDGPPPHEMHTTPNIHTGYRVAQGAFVGRVTQ